MCMAVPHRRKCWCRCWTPMSIHEIFICSLLAVPAQMRRCCTSALRLLRSISAAAHRAPAFSCAVHEPWCAGRSQCKKPRCRAGPPPVPCVRDWKGERYKAAARSMAASIIAAHFSTWGISSGPRPGSGARTPPRIRPSRRRRISFITAYRLPRQAHMA